MVSCPSIPSTATASLAEARSNSLLPEVRSDEFLPKVGRSVSLAGLALSCSVALAIAVSAVTTYKVIVKANATVRPTGELRLVQSELDGSVEQILIRENQSVKQGDVIAILDDEQLQIKKNQLTGSLQQLQLQSAQIDAQAQSLNTQIQAETSYRDRAISAAQSDLVRTQRELVDRQITVQTELTAAQATLQKAESDFRKAEADARFATRDQARYAELVAQGAIAQRTLEEKQQVVQQTQASMTGEKETVALYRARVKAAAAAVDPSDAGVAIAQSKIAQEADRGNATIASLKKELQGLTQRRAELKAQIQQQQKELEQTAFQLQRSQIRATHDGVVLKLNLRNVGQVLRTGDEVAQISPSGSLLVLKANVETQDIQKVTENQVVQMRLKACPYTDFGVLEGRVAAIAPDAVSAAAGGNGGSGGSGGGNRQGSGQNGQGNATYFEVIVQPKTQRLSRNHRDCILQAGMSAQAEIITQKDTVLKFLLRKARLLTNL